MPENILGRRGLIATAVVLTLISLPLQLSSQVQSIKKHDSVSVGTVGLTLGMRESEAVSRLSEQFQLRDHSTVGPNSSWQICEKNISQTSPCLGSVVFESGKLVEATRRWPQAGTPAAFAESLHLLAAKLVSDGRRACRLDVVTVRDRFSTDDSTVIICGQKQLGIGFISPDPRAPPYIVEVLQSTGE